MKRLILLLASTIPAFAQCGSGSLLGYLGSFPICKPAAGGGAGNPGGSNGQVQINNAGTFGGLALTGIPKLTGGVASVAIGGTDYENPLTFTVPLTRTVNTIACAVATGSVAGCLSSADWTAFNGKQAAGNYLTDSGANGPIKRTALNTTAPAVAADIVGLFSGCSGVLSLGADGACHAGGSTPLTTKGDLFGHSTVDARIPIGADTFVLTADSTQALGLKWAAPTGGGSGLSTTVTIDFSGSAVNDGACSAFVTGRPFAGVTSGQPINLSMATAGNQLKGFQFFAVGDGADTFKAQWCNLSGGAVTLASQSFNAAAGGGGGGSGTLAVQANGTPVGSSATLNIVPGAGITPVVTNAGGINIIQNVIDPVVAVTNTNLQAGAPLKCASASVSGTAFTCSQNPALTAYTPNMVINWVPDVNGSGGATTLNVDAQGAKSVKASDCSTNPTASDIVGGIMKQLFYNGTSLCFLAAAATTAGTPLQTAWDVWGFNVGGVGSEIEGVANRVHYYSLPVDAPGRVFSKLAAYTGSNTKDVGAIAWGIYDSTCTVIANGKSDTQVGTGSQQVRTWTFPATLTLTPGQYFLGWSSDNTATGFYASFRGAYITDLLTSAAATYVFYGANVSTTSGGVTTMPTTCGAHTSPGSFAGAFFPGIVMY